MKENMLLNSLTLLELEIYMPDYTEQPCLTFLFSLILVNKLNY